jgi:hypothetical protein
VDRPVRREPALQSDLDAPPHRLGGQDGGRGHGHGHPSVTDRNHPAGEGGKYSEVDTDEEGGERNGKAAVDHHTSDDEAYVVQVVLQHRDRDRDHDCRRPQGDDHNGLEVGEGSVRGGHEENGDHDHRYGGEPDDLPPQQGSAPAPADDERREGDQPAEADHGRPEVPLSKIVDGWEVVLAL